MKRKTFGAGKVKLIKTSISLPEPLAAFAEKRQTSEGFYSLSAYLTHLIRMDKERQEEKEKGTSSSSTFNTAPHVLNETDEKKKKAAS
jgi:Arc/MetJ-type ribon-helix-helix transcriptional regulator